jgi:hypothetical protein
MTRVMLLYVVLVAWCFAGFYGTASVPDASQAQAQGDPPSTAEIDVDRWSDHDTFARIRATIVGCQPVIVNIHYAFGSAGITTHHHERACRLQINIMGELTEEHKPKVFVCDVAVINMIDWFQIAGTRRGTPPLSELQALPLCHRE